MSLSPGGVVLGSLFAGYVPLASRSPIRVYYSPVITLLNIETNICNKNVTRANDSLKRLPRQFCWENTGQNDCTQKFKDALRSSSTQILIREFLNENEQATNEKHLSCKSRTHSHRNCKTLLDKIRSRHKACTIIFKQKLV